MDKMHIYEKRIKDAIKSKLVIQNKQSIDFAVNEISKVVFSAHWDGYQKGYEDAQREATKEIHKNYKPID